MAPCAIDDEPLPMLATTLHTGKPSTVLASVLHGPRDLRMDTRSLEDPLAGELQIAIKSTGICGSDVSYYKKFANGDLCACAPLSLGHESSGVVVAVGPSVRNFGVGDRIALEVGVPCGECGICRRGRYNLCRKMRFRSSAKSVPHFQGTLQERINHPAIWCHKLPDHISFDAAALLEPLSVALHSVNRATPAPGSTALVLGAGTVGLLVAATARHAGCTAVTIVDVDAGRVAYALAHGFATHGHVVPKPLALHPSPSPSPLSSSGASTPALSASGFMTPLSQYATVASRLADAKSLAAEILAVSQIPSPSSGLLSSDEDEDPGVDATFECTGSESCMQTALYATRPGGKVIMVGMGTPIQTLPLSAAHLREVDILGIFRYANTYPTAIRMVGARCLPSLDGMVTHRVNGLRNAARAFELATRTVDEEGRLILKVVIEA